MKEREETEKIKKRKDWSEEGIREYKKIIEKEKVADWAEMKD